ncbi:MAG TPA: ABC transporter substrate-binding protein [Polyangiaceae bacterium]|nr:ABC transporter substrate-binding protein [Polyangiaceae bacterium]
MGGPRALSRRAFVGGALAAAAAGCGRPEGEPGVLRVGYAANLTHAPMLVGVASGRIARATGLKVEARVFRAGPRVVEALLGRAIDVGICGPAPLLAAHARLGPGKVVVLGGCASGGASLVLSTRLAGSAPAELRGRTLATPQLGSTQDVALRRWLSRAGLRTTDRGGEVRVTALAPAVAKAEMIRGGLDGAWMPEPWATLLVHQVPARRALDERELWPDRTFASALVAARGEFVAARPGDAGRVREALAAEIARALAAPETLRDEAFAELIKLRTRPEPRDWFGEAAGYIDFTVDAMRPAVEAFARDAEALGVLPSASCAGLFYEGSALV